MRILELALSGTVGTPHMGPVSTVICELSNRFVSRGHKVFLADVPCAIPRALLHPDVRVIELSGLPQSRAGTSSRSKLGSAWQRWRNYFFCLRELASNIDLGGIDVVHLHAPVPAFLLHRMHNVRVFYTAHTPVWSLEKGKGSFRAWVERDVIRHSRLTVALGDYLTAAVPDSDMVTIANGLNLDAWTPTDRSHARQALGIDGRDFVALFTGRVVHVKGIDVLVRAVRELAPHIPKLKVFVVGPLSGSFDTRDEKINPYARSVMEAAQGLPVSFTGFINHSDPRLRQYFAAADVFVLPSRHEPQGLVVLESMAMGTPVIGSATGGIPDMVSEDVGYLFPPGDAAALAQCVLTAYSEPEALHRKRAAARTRVAMNYSWETVSDRYLAAFRDALKASAPENDI